MQRVYGTKKVRSRRIIGRKGRGMKASFGEKGTLQDWTLPIEGDKGKRRGRLSKFRQTTPSDS